MIATEINMNWALQLCKYVIKLTDKAVATGSKYFNFLKFQRANVNVPPNAAMK
jgi:hypothetical protein